MSGGDINLMGISKSFAGKAVLEDFSAVIKGGEVNCILGASGSGKTTIGRIICSLETPDGGVVEGIEGRRLSVVFQEDRLCDGISSLSNVRFVSGASVQEIEKAFLDTGLDGVEGQVAGTLSGGQRRRVALVRAVLADCDVLLMDEPFKGLDGKTKERVMKWVKGMTAGKTVILITHDSSEADFMGCSNTVVVD
ncbi:MAG: ATP-binding cassette domain-containing protein [Sphaerochaetaceae bacterium]